MANKRKTNRNTDICRNTIRTHKPNRNPIYQCANGHLTDGQALSLSNMIKLCQEMRECVLWLYCFWVVLCPESQYLSNCISEGVQLQLACNLFKDEGIRESDI